MAHYELIMSHLIRIYTVRNFIYFCLVLKEFGWTGTWGGISVSFYEKGDIISVVYQQLLFKIPLINSIKVNLQGK